MAARLPVAELDLVRFQADTLKDKKSSVIFIEKYDKLYMCTPEARLYENLNIPASFETLVEKIFISNGR